MRLRFRLTLLMACVGIVAMPLAAQSDSPAPASTSSPTSSTPITTKDPAALKPPAEQAPQTPQNAVTLDTSEALFTVLASINHCGYDAELDLSNPLRGQIRAEIAKNVKASTAAGDASQLLCQFYTDHPTGDNAKTLAEYVSLALYLTPPPDLSVKGKETDLPPDASVISGILPFMQKFYAEAGLHAIWMAHRAAYAELIQHYHEPVANMLFDTEAYLRLPSAGYLGHSFTVYLDPQGAPGQTNARNYGADYYVVLSPGLNMQLKMAQVRHTYLHYLLEPMALRYPGAIKQLDPLLEVVKNAPMDANFKTSSSLLMTECLIRAIEARTAGSSRAPEAERQQAVQESMEQGYVLTQYFYDELVRFEKDNTSFRTAYGNMLANIDVGKEKRIASQIQFASKADQEIVHLGQPMQGKLLVTAEQRLSAGDAATAQRLAQEALDEKNGDAGQALFIMARAATMQRDMDGAKKYFEETLTVAHERQVVAWSHIYLGRIFDLQEERDAALDHYRAALGAGGELPEVKAAAERGIRQPYEPPARPQ